MTLVEFQTKFKFKFENHVLDNGTYIAITKVIRRSDNMNIDRVKTSIDIHETNIWISDSQSPISLIEWDWNKIIDQTKRAQLDYFAQRVPITDFFPMNSDTNISNLYN